ncbi:MAG TPA: hypothetical protein VNT77_01250 [Allosphingosinicella sp.]|nr:hypothetical protein [Allosphingosinicella sp.]
MRPEETVGGGKGRRVQARKPRKDGWTAARRQIFLDHLATCSNIRRACAAVGLSTQSVHALAKRDPEFAVAQEEALEAGYRVMESLLVERAAGTVGYMPGDSEVPDPQRMDSELALNLLRLRGAHRRAGAAPDGPKPRKASAAELTEAILAKLDHLSRRRKRKK